MTFTTLDLLAIGAIAFAADLAAGIVTWRIYAWWTEREDTKWRAEEAKLDRPIPYELVGDLARQASVKKRLGPILDHHCKVRQADGDGPEAA